MKVDLKLVTEMIDKLGTKISVRLKDNRVSFGSDYGTATISEEEGEPTLSFEPASKISPQTEQQKMDAAAELQMKTFNAINDSGLTVDDDYRLIVEVFGAICAIVMVKHGFEMEQFGFVMSEIWAKAAAAAQQAVPTG